MQNNILLLGSINMDIATKLPKIPVVNDVIYCDELKINLGGKASNAAVACTRLGVNSYLLGAIGRDFIGVEMQKILRSEKIKLDHVTEKQGQNTGSTIVEVDSEGKNIILVDKAANYTLTRDDIDEAFKGHGSGKVQFNLFYTTLEPKEDIVAYAINSAFERNILVFCDAAPRPTKTIIDLLSKIDFIAPNQKETEIMTGIPINSVADAFLAVKKIREMGGNTVIISMSSLGAVVLEKGKSTPDHVEAVKVKAVDETAAGDAFRAGFCASYLKGGNIHDSVVFANKAGALAASKFGAYDSMPFLVQIEKN